MKKHLLFFLLICFSGTFLNAQTAEDLCATADGNSSYTVNGSDNFNLVVAGLTDDGAQDPNSCGLGTDVDAFFAFEVGTTGAYEIDVTPTGGTGSICVDFGEDCAGLELLDPTVCQILEAGTTYVIGVFFETGGEGDVNIDFNEVEPDDNNDECTDAGPITGDVDGSNECATSNESLACTGDAVASVWYTYTVPADIATLTIGVSPGTMGGNPIFALLQDDCSTYYLDTAADSESCDGTEIIIDCPTEGDVINILVASDVGSEGTFSIKFTEDLKDLACTGNDDCSLPEFLPLSGAPCEIQFFDGCNNTACPENFTNCDYDSFSAVWYELPLDPGATGLIINVEPAGTFEWGVIESASGDLCDNTGNTFVGGECNDAETEVTLTATGIGQTHYLVIASDPSDEGNFTIEITQIIPPPGDEPCDSNGFADDDFVELGASDSHSNTTCCAVGANDDPALDFANQDCSTASDDNSVWYRVMIDFQFDGMEIDISGSADITAEVYNGSATAGCSGFGTPLNSFCAGPEILYVAFCDGMDDYIWIKVSSADDDCGDFTINVLQEKTCTQADDCGDSSSATLFEPVTDLTGAFDFICLQGCMKYACPEATFTECGFGMMPVIWFEVTTDVDAAQLYANVTVNGGGSWDPVFAIYEGDCTMQTAVGTAATQICSDAWPNGANTDQINQPVVDVIETYWVAVGANGDLQDIYENPDFEICVSTTITLIICLGDGSCTPASDWELMDSDIDGQDLGPIDPANTPVLCQGETVEVCSDFFYDASATGVDWLIGVVPIFGDGWNLDIFDPSTATVNGNGMPGVWFDPPDVILQEFVGTLCTYTDAAGVLQLCNVLCGTCPCTAGIPAGTELPGGWFWVSNGGNAGCDNDGTPGEGWGIGSVTANVDFCFELTVRDDFADAGECNSADLTIGFQTFSDGVAGCWEDPVGECLLDEAQSITFSIQCDIPPEVEIQGQPCPDLTCDISICTKGFVNQELDLDDGSTLDIEVVFDDNGTGVTGGNDHTFTGGVGTIPDQLCNDSSTPQTVTYYLMSVDPSVLCPGPTTELNVTVYPQIEGGPVELETCPQTDDDNVGDVDVCVSPMGGTGNYSYEWSNGAGDVDCWVLSQPLSSDFSPYTYMVTVTDDLGCTGIIDVEVIVHPEVIFEFPIDQQTAFCLDPNGSGSDCVGTIEFETPTSGTPAYTYDWGTIGSVPGLDYEINNSTNFMEIDLCSSVPNEFTVELVVIDVNGCTAVREIDIELVDSPMATITDNSTCDDGSGNQEFIINVSANDLYLITIENLTTGVISPNAASGSGDDDFTVIGTGDYEITLVDFIAGCETVIIHNIDPPPATDIEISGNSPICIGETMMIQVDNAGAYSNFLWSDASMSTGSSISDNGLIVTTTYQVTATDATGCSTTAAYEVVVNPLPTAQISGSLSYCVNSSTTLTASGGSSYEWMLPGGGTSNDNPLMVTSPGAYTVIVTDANSCTASTFVDVIEDSSLNPQLSGGDICDAGMVELDAGAGFDSYSWEAPNGSAAGSTQLIDADMGGEYSVTVSDAAGCTGEGTFTVNVFDTPMVTEPAPIDLCNSSSTGASTMLNIGSIIPGVSGDYYDNGLLISNLNLDADGMAVQTLNYTFTTNTATLPCVDQTVDVVINIIECMCPPVAVNDPPELCSTDNLFNLSAIEQPAIGDGTWSGNGVNANGEFDPSIGGGTYELTFTLLPENQGPQSCDPTASVMITVHPAVTIEPNAMVEACNSDESGGDTTVNLDDYFINSDPGNWTDQSGQTVNGILDFDGENVGAVFVFSYETNNAIAPCMNASASLTVEIIDCVDPPCPDPDLTNPSQACNDNDMVDLDASIGDTGVTGYWQDASGNQISNVVDVTSLGIGTIDYTYVLDPAPPPGCQGTFPLTLDVISQNNPGEASPDILHICEDDVNVIQLPSLIDPASDPDVGGEWRDDPANVYVGSPFDDNGGTFDPNGQAVGTYVFTYGWYNNPPCDDVWTTITIVIDPNPAADAGPDGELNCDNADTGITLDGSSSTGVAPLNYMWVETTNGVTISDPTNPIITVTEPGTYVINVTDANGCEDSDSASINTDPNLPTMTVEGTSPICPGDTPGFIEVSNVTGGLGPYEFSIDGGATWTTDLLFSDLPAGPYEVLLRDANSCIFTATAEITQAANPSVFVGNDQTIQLGATYEIVIVDLNYNPDDVANMVWTANGIEIYNGPYSETLPVTPGEASIEYCLTITDINGCVAIDCVLLKTQVVIDIYIPNIISTASTSGNNSFYVQSPDVELIKQFYIYDRWGERIFGDDKDRMPNDPSVGWFGDFNDKRVVDGVYVYFIEVLYVDGTSEKLAGSITVVH